MAPTVTLGSTITGPLAGPDPRLRRARPSASRREQGGRRRCAQARGAVLAPVDPAGGLRLRRAVALGSGRCAASSRRQVRHAPAPCFGPPARQSRSDGGRPARRRPKGGARPRADRAGRVSKALGGLSSAAGPISNTTCAWARRRPHPSAHLLTRPTASPGFRVPTPLATTERCSHLAPAIADHTHSIVLNENSHINCFSSDGR